MPPSIIAPGPAAADRDAYRGGPLDEFLTGAPFYDLAQAEIGAEPTSQAVVFAPYLLQDIADHRGALQRWFALVATGGFLVVTVPHAFLYERQDGAPSRLRDEQRRLYTPRALVEEIEEALVPNSYRVRWLGDLDQGYDYSADERVGRHDVAVAIERIVPPAWNLAEPMLAQSPPRDLFEPDRTRVERVGHVPAERILALKLDHLGDFVMSIAALERLRAAFPAAEITLVVGSWNESLARALALADRVVAFDGFPRNSGEERPDIGGKTALFDALITDHYDLAIDLRTDPDTRFLLRNVHATVKAGIGLHAQFPFLDIFLPVSDHIAHFDRAWQQSFGPNDFRAGHYCARSPYSIGCDGERAAGEQGAIVYGPYHALPPGDYIFEPFLEIDQGRPGLIACDVALNTQRVGYQVLAEPQPVQLRFRNDQDHAQFEFRLFPVDEEATPDFRFYGGRLSKRGEASGLHQSEYLILLIELIALRLGRTGLLIDTAHPVSGA